MPATNVVTALSAAALKFDLFRFFRNILNGREVMRRLFSLSSLSHMSCRLKLMMR